MFADECREMLKGKVVAKVKKKKSKIKKRLLQFTALLTLGGLLAWIFIPSPIPVKVDEVRVGSFSAIVEADGMTQARDHITLWAPVTGIPQRMPLAVGSPVVVKQIAARFVPDAAAFQDAQTLSYLNERMKAAANAKSLAIAERERTAAVVNQAREKLHVTELSTSEPGNALERDKAQVAMKLIFKELDSMDAAIRAANFDMAAAENALNQLKGAPPRDWELRAPVSGIVLAVAENGKPVAIGDTLIEIGNPMDLEVVVETSASNATQVSAGQRVQLLPAREEALPGRVRRVENIPAKDATSPSKSRIAIEFTARPAKWRNLGNSHPVNARITIATIDQVLKISAKALIADSQQKAVFVIEHGRARKQAISVSTRDAETLVIESGLKENDRVILSPGPNIKDGVRVQAL